MACAFGCGASARPQAQTPTPEPEVASPEPTGLVAQGKGDLHMPCIILETEAAGRPTELEGVLFAMKAANGKAPVAPLILRLTRPRCVVGLEHASVVTEVYIASTGIDVRPFLTQRIR